ncbi:universal stress protein [Flavihumibacter petaseus]|uniref:UspA domain-containing protein n=1 Tax=Flavihumibacter petaseus NBRC 106054 TaxID=1220578 RepID=A0A0E9N6P6_9BACT|nr:universal stress protein [Flavihumibacter petaseus]GAO45020.1 hypothetical protein FPE01S_04_02630 [Flavihumibacter petaseus NBRC 106054]
MKLILVATDFSEPSKNAAGYAAHLAKQNGADICLLHAYMLPTPVSEVPYVMVSVEEIQQENEKQAKLLAEQLEAITGSPVRTIVNIGMPADEVVYQAKELNADLIVTGMRGENSGIDKLIGSTTAAIMRKSHIPVLVIPAGVGYVAPSTITYATDFSYTMNMVCLNLLQEWVKRHADAKIKVIHVQKPNEVMTAEQVSGKVRLEQKISGLPHKFYVATNASVEAGLDSFLNDNPSQLLVMVAHRHSWWNRLVNGSHTREMAYRADIPLLVLQDKD